MLKRITTEMAAGAAAAAALALGLPPLASADGYCSRDFNTSSACAVNTASTTVYPGSSFANNETDYYVFYAQANTELSASVLDEGTPSCGGGYCAGDQIELTDAYGNVLAGGLYNDNGDTDWSYPIGSSYQPQGPLYISYIFKGAGTYYLKVEGGLDGSDPSPVPYSLTVNASPNVQWPAPPVSAPPPTCRVPSFHGASLATVKRRLIAGHCTVGRVRYKFNRARKGTVIAESRSAGTVLQYRYPVGVTVSRGRRR